MNSVRFFLFCLRLTPLWCRALTWSLLLPFPLQRPGDSILLSFAYCQDCHFCTTGHPVGCSEFVSMNFGRVRKGDTLKATPTAKGVEGRDTLGEPQCISLHISSRTSYETHTQGSRQDRSLAKAHLRSTRLLLNLL